MSSNSVLISGDVPLGDQVIIYLQASENAKNGQKRQILFGKIFCFIFAYIYFRKAAALSDQLKGEVGLKGMNKDDLRNRSVILQKRKQYKEFLICSQEFLSRNNICIECRIRMEMKRAEVLDTIGEDRDAGMALFHVEGLIPEAHPTVGIDFYIAFAKHYRKQPKKAKECLAKALEIADKKGLFEDIKKIKEIQCRLK